MKNDYENHWILPEISVLEKSGTSKKVSLFLQDLTVSGGSSEYARSVSGNSLRVGSINEAASRNVPPYAVIMHGGHDMTGTSASWEYVITTPMSAMPGDDLQYIHDNHASTVSINMTYSNCYSYLIFITY